MLFLIDLAFNHNPVIIHNIVGYSLVQSFSLNTSQLSKETAIKVEGIVKDNTDLLEKELKCVLEVGDKVLGEMEGMVAEGFWED